jgi:hypothetical protein
MDGSTTRWTCRTCKLKNKPPVGICAFCGSSAFLSGFDVESGGGSLDSHPPAKRNVDPINDRMPSAVSGPLIKAIAVWIALLIAWIIS